MGTFFQQCMQVVDATLISLPHEGQGFVEEAGSAAGFPC
jgi:hypothetical protein